MCGAFKSINFSCSQMPFAKKCFADAIKRFSHDRIECVFLGRWVGTVLDGTDEKKISANGFSKQQEGEFMCAYIPQKWSEGEKLSKGLQKTFHLLALMLLMLINCGFFFLRGKNIEISVKCCIKAYPWDISGRQHLLCTFTFYSF